MLYPVTFPPVFMWQFPTYSGLPLEVYFSLLTSHSSHFSLAPGLPPLVDASIPTLRTFQCRLSLTVGLGTLFSGQPQFQIGIIHLLTALGIFVVCGFPQGVWSFLAYSS